MKMKWFETAFKLNIAVPPGQLLFLTLCLLCINPVKAQDYSPFTVTTEDTVSVETDVQLSAHNDSANSSNFSQLSPRLTKQADTVFTLIRRNKVSLDNSNTLDIRSVNLDDQQSDGLKALILEYSEKYSAPEKIAKDAMCEYFNSPQNEDEPVAIRALNAFEFLENQEDMEARLESIGNEFMLEVRSELGEEVFQSLQTERDRIHAAGSIHPMSSKEFIVSQNFDITEVVTTNCSRGVNR